MTFRRAELAIGPSGTNYCEASTDEGILYIEPQNVVKASQKMTKMLDSFPLKNTIPIIFC